MSNGGSGLFVRVALTRAEIDAMTGAELGHHVASLIPNCALVLGIVLEYLKDKGEVRLGLLRHLGLLKDEPTPPATTTPAEGV